MRGDVTTITVEGYFSAFKIGMGCMYQHCAKHHLRLYLAKFDFRYNEREAKGMDECMRTDSALHGISGKRLSYRGLTQRAKHGRTQD